MHQEYSSLGLVYAWTTHGTFYYSDDPTIAPSSALEMQLVADGNGEILARSEGTRGRFVFNAKAFRPSINQAV